MLKPIKKRGLEGPFFIDNDQCVRNGAMTARTQEGPLLAMKCPHWRPLIHRKRREI
jgi:hypothetical protein